MSRLIVNTLLFSRNAPSPALRSEVGLHARPTGSSHAKAQTAVAGEVPLTQIDSGGAAAHDFVRWRR